uniref:Uncharacterized protein n=1 Tax=Octopus bimaculoides TaxID=37653 RepID=A0A0L8HSK0_OCTBM
MTGEQQEERESVLLETFPRRMRRNAMADIFENIEDHEKFRDFLLHTNESNSNSDGEVDSMSDDNLDEFETEDLRQCTENTNQELSQSSENLPNRGTAGCKETTKVLSLQISQEERLGGSSLPLCRDANRPSCLTNICTAATSSTSSCQLISSPNVDSSNLSPSAEMLTINFPDDSTPELLSPDHNNSKLFSRCRTRRNALHDLLETLTEADCEKLKMLYQSSLANASSYSFQSSFSDLTQGPMRNFHECKA